MLTVYHGSTYRVEQPIFCYLLSFTASSIRDTNCGLLGRAVVPKSTICPFLLINR